MKRILRTAALGLGATIAMAHVGNPNVVFDGNAGPYAVRVIVRPPQVVPGRADVVVKVLTPGAERVVVQPEFWRVGAAGTPNGDAASPTPGAPGTFETTVWLMSRGEYSINVTVSGAAGAGAVHVPVLSVATGRLGFSRTLTIILIPLALLLFAGLVTIVRAASGDSLVPVGDDVRPAVKRRARVAAAVSVPLLALAVFGGARWWSAVDADYQSTMFRPLAAKVTVTPSPSSRIRIALRDTSVAQTSLMAPGLIPDHGKIMHLFMLADSADLSPNGNRSPQFAHLHPRLTDSASLTFETWRPPLGDGRYRVFADVVFETGAEETVATTIVLDGGIDGSDMTRWADRADPDDAVAHGIPALIGAGGAVDTANVSGTNWTVSWAGSAAAIQAGKDVDLRFVVRDQSGKPAALAPYMGMPAHAAVMSSDGSVFSHLHPTGTVSMAAATAFHERDQGDTTADGHLRSSSSMAVMPQMEMPRDGVIDFPYVFPKAGSYRIWVEVRTATKVAEILSVPFDIVIH